MVGSSSSSSVVGDPGGLGSPTTLGPVTSSTCQTPDPSTCHSADVRPGYDGRLTAKVERIEQTLRGR